MNAGNGGRKDGEVELRLLCFCYPRQLNFDRRDMETERMERARAAPSVLSNVACFVTLDL